MILHCTPPYAQNISNPALAYLKGFLEARGIKVRNVYWNLVLARSMSKFQRVLARYAESKELLSYLPTLYVSRNLLREKPGNENQMPIDQLFLSQYSREEIIEFTDVLKSEIDYYIKKNSLHETLIAGFTLKTCQWLMGYYLIRRLKELNPQINIVLGGINESQALKFMQIFEQADFAVWGEGEYPLFHLVSALEEGNTVLDVPDLVYRDGSKVKMTNAVHQYPSLDSYPFADHSDYIETFENYMADYYLSGHIQSHRQHASHQVPVLLSIWGSRSCPWNKCRFCVLNDRSTYRARSPENIVQEIEFQSEKYGINSFIFVDTEPPGSMKRFRTLLKLIVQSSLNWEKKYRFFAEFSPIFIDSETAQYLRLASFAEIQIGFEALTDSLLEKMGKRQRFVHNIQALKLGSQYGLEMRGLNLVRGIPTETKEDILESCANLKFLRFLLKKYPLIPRFLVLYKGAPFYEDVSEEERKEWKDNPVWAEIEQLHLIPESDKYEFFGFLKASQNCLWSDFENLLRSYEEGNCSYEWIEYKSSSCIEEKGLRHFNHVFDRDETDLLIFCDTLKTFSEIKKRFSHLSEDKILEMLRKLKNAGMIYYDTDLSSVISILEASRRTVYPQLDRN